MTKAKALTEEQWRTCEEPYALMRHLQQHCLVSRVKGGRRRQRLYACACCRLAWHLLSERGRGLVELAERAADGKASRLQLAAAEAEAREIQSQVQREMRSNDSPDTRELRVRLLLGFAVVAATTSYLSTSAYAAMPVGAALTAAQEVNGGLASPPANGPPFADLLRDIFRDPFRPALALDPAWLAWKNGTVKQMARAIYDERRWEDMPILADALEEAGCADADLLGHCRASTPHARGCWAVDLLLGVT